MAHRTPPERTETIRQKLLTLLARDSWTARQAADELGVREAELVEHLAHLERTARQHAKRLRVEPARCKACGFEFRQRERLGRPRRCPVCKKERIAPPRFTIEDAKS